MILDNKRLTEDERMKLLADMEQEETRALQAMVADEAVAAYRAAQDDMLIKKLKRLPHSNFALWRELSPIERRLLLDFAVAQVKEMDERISFMSRNICVGELELPDNLREGSDIPLRAVR